MTSKALCITVAALAASSGVASTSRNLSAKDFQLHAQRVRGLQTSEDMLCNTATQNDADVISPMCDSDISSLSVTTWDACCAFKAEHYDEALCRTWTSVGEYCSETDECASDDDACVCDLDDDHTLTISVAFEELPEEETCCKSCTCYGDPECVSFDGSQDVWIPCDGRVSESRCFISKSVCTAMDGPSGGKCNWIRDNKSTSKGWNQALYGSPCVPDLSDPDVAVMNMYNSNDNDVKIDLQLGERGIIQEVRFEIGNKEYQLDAQRCFDIEGADAWTGDSIPDEWRYSIDPNQKAVSWVVYDADANTMVKLLCSRAIQGGVNGLPRVNVQEVSVATDDQSTGFCSAGVINDKKGDTEKSNAIHRSCVQDHATALQGCKFLVNFGATNNELSECAAQYCRIAQVDENDCIKEMGDGTKATPWIREYCTALKNLGTITKSQYKNCLSQVRNEGWDFATSTYGKGYKPLTNDECATSITEYEIDNKNTCDQGVFIDLMVDDEWVPTYFIPSTLPPCDGALVVPFTDAKDLFTHSIAFRQCDPRAESDCAGLSSCSQTVGIEFSLEFSNSIRNLSELLSSGVLACVPRSNDPTGSTTWCLPNAEDYQPVDECVCGEPQGRPGRRMLAGKQ